jgi:hypothetical protein
VDSALKHTTSWLHAELRTDKCLAYLSHSKMGNTKKIRITFPYLQIPSLFAESSNSRWQMLNITFLREICLRIKQYLRPDTFINLAFTEMSRSQWPRGLRRKSAAARLLRSWARIPPEGGGGHGCLSVVRVVCCQVEVSATSRSLVQRSPTDCGVSLCVI